LTPIFFHRRNLIQRGKIQPAVLEDVYMKIKTRKLKPTEIPVILIDTNHANQKMLDSKTKERFGDKVIILNLRNLEDATKAYFRNIIINPDYRNLLQGEGLMLPTDELDQAREHLNQVQA